MEAKAPDPRPALKQLPAETPGGPEKRQRTVPAHTPLPHAAPSTPAQTALPSTPAPGSQQANGELLDYLRGRGGRIKELEDELARSKMAHAQLRAEASASQQAMRRMEVDLRAVQARAAAAEMRNAASSPQDTYTQQVENLLDAELAKSLDLEQQLGALRQRLAAAEERAAGAEGSVRTLKAEADRAARASALQLANLQRQCDLIRAEAAEAVSKAERSAAQAEQQAAAEAESHRHTSARVAEAEAGVAAQARAAASLRQQLSEHLAKQASAHPPSTAALHQRVRDLEHQLQQLRGGIRGGADVGKPGVTSADSPSAAAGPGHSEAEQLVLPMVSSLREELARAQNELAQWQQLRQALPGVRGPEAAMAALEAQVAEATESRTTLRLREEEGEALRARADATQAEVTTLSEKVAGMSTKLQTALADVAITQRKLAVITQERNSLHRALREPPPNSDGGPQSIGRARPKGLQGYRARGDEQGVLRAENAALKASVTSLSRQVENLAARSKVPAPATPAAPEAAGAAGAAAGAADAPSGAGIGAGDASGGGDVASRSGSAVGGGGSGVEGGTASHSGQSGAVGVSGGGLAAVAAKDAEIAVLRHKVGEADKAMVRLREVFKERAAAFREAVHLLFGYRVDMTSEATAARNAGSAPTTLSLRPQHFHEPDALLVFRLTRERGMELVPTSWTTGKLAREVDTFINKFKSIPAFTANLTMEGFQKATQC
ncbi:mitotic checkpoint protein-domain-containing protein [Dunaliella salina]|uniref:Mitotic checkpoint protein-domain-containing protein n=1 Tax=Dunaliella salina TaxID=3046 RepID=A0ABQ7G277_DUNSA|nr:mitotic checkpoint protein-domain-containing protein [Dunaliella salina]|eukprot:KAF5828705.1 mitotic checkpoint protein-domain-containing protein [Dunaliella salina]